MKLVLYAFLLSLLSPSLAFAPGAPSVARTRTTYQELQARSQAFGRSKNKERASLIPDEDEASPGGFVSGLLGDKEDNDFIAKEAKAILKRFGKKTPNASKEKTEVEEQKELIDWEVKADGMFGCLPSKEMTGVEPAMTQLCATISMQLYSKSSFDEFKLSTKDMKTDLFIYDNHGAFFDATPPFLVAITGKTMILGWRGTSSLVDGLNDAAASPQSSLAWRKHAKTIKAQGAMTSIVHNDIVTHEKAIIAKAKELGITEIITTGQSLGGGCSQIGHLTIRAQIQDEVSPWNELQEQGVNVRSVAFCGPMTTVLVDNATPGTDEFVEGLWNNSCNFVYKNDPVPRAYGYLSFIEDLVDNATEDLTKAIPLPWILKRLFDVQGKLEDLVAGAKDNESLVGVLGIFSQYRHMGNLVYYESEDAKPVVLKDMGAFHKNTKGEKNLFRNIKYKPVKKPIEDFMGWHMDIIRAPGLSYPREDLMK